MASALASPPPPLPFGAPDLKRNARTFLERALVISAIVHLAAVGAFRASEERSLARDVEVAPPVWSRPVDVIPDLIPRTWVIRPVTPATEGKIVPVEDIKPPTFEPENFGSLLTGPGSSRTPTPGGTDVSRGPGPLPPPPQPTRAFIVAEIPPVPILAPLPKYPDFAREAGIEGRVIVRALIGVDGIPRHVTAISGPKPLFDAAVEGVRQWRFRPGMTSGQPVEVWVEIPVVFRLGS